MQMPVRIVQHTARQADIESQVLREVGFDSRPQQVLWLLLCELPKVMRPWCGACWKGVDEVSQAGTGLPDVKSRWHTPCMSMQTQTARAQLGTVISSRHDSADNAGVGVECARSQPLYIRNE